MTKLEQWLEAYYDCRRNKRRTASATRYEMNYESNLIRLRDRVNGKTYSPGRSICFVVTRPRYREVFAADFEDRIVHHYIALRLEPLFEKIFSNRTFNCRKGKGQQYGVRCLSADIRECSEGYTKDCWVMKLDLQGFFMSIPKKMLADMIDRFIRGQYEGEDKEELRFMCKTVIMHSPELDCERRSPKTLWEHLPKNKSLFTNGKGRGIAIGNLFAQLFANFLLNGLDWLLPALGFTFRGRYVDDFYMVSRDKGKLLEAVPKIREHLAQYGLRLSPRKFYLQHYSKGVEFTGMVVKRDRVYVKNRTVGNAFRAIDTLNRAGSREELESALSCVNSYLGALRQAKTYNIRRRLARAISGETYGRVYWRGALESLHMKKRLGRREETLRYIRGIYAQRNAVAHSALPPHAGRGADRQALRVVRSGGRRTARGNANNINRKMLNG